MYKLAVIALLPLFIVPTVMAETEVVRFTPDC